SSPAASVYARLDGLDPDDRRRTRNVGADRRGHAAPDGDSQRLPISSALSARLRPLPPRPAGADGGGGDPFGVLAGPKMNNLSADAAPLVELIDVARHFDVSPPWLNRVLERKPRALLKAVDGVSFTIAKGETLGLVGESGCGKSTVARLIVGLYRPTRGEVRYAGRLVDFADPELALRRTMQMIFQDPYASLNPRWRVKDIVAEPIRAHGLAQTPAALAAKVVALLEQV